MGAQRQATTRDDEEGLSREAKEGGDVAKRIRRHGDVRTNKVSSQKTHVSIFVLFHKTIQHQALQ